MPNPKPKPSRKPRALSLSLTLGLTLSLALTQAAFSLLDQPGTDANCRDAGGRSVLMIAACAGHGDLVRLLLQARLGSGSGLGVRGARRPCEAAAAGTTCTRTCTCE